MRIAQQENSAEKRRWVAWFTRETNKTSRQEVCTTYLGRRRSVFPKERRHWGLTGRILEAQAKLVSLAGSALQMETQPEFERENDMRRPVFWGTDPIFLFFQGLFLYTEMLYKSHMGSAVLIFIKVRCFIQMYTEVVGVLHHLLAREACWQFMTLSLWQRSVNTYFSRGDYS